MVLGKGDDSRDGSGQGGIILRRAWPGGDDLALDARDVVAQGG